MTTSRIVISALGTLVRRGVSVLPVVALVGSMSFVARAAPQPVPAAETGAAVSTDTKTSGGSASIASGARGAAPAPLRAVVRGFFVGARFGGGYMVMSQKIDDTTNWPQLTRDNTKEGYGMGSLLQIEAGYDITPIFAVEAIGGVSLISGTRTDRVRDLGVVFGGVALRAAPAISERLRLVVAAGGGFGRADNAVEAPESGPIALLNVGVEYYVHVRHFSVGIDVSVLAPVSPLRMYVGVGPQVKYTF